MTVSTINSVAEFVTNGVTKNFPFYFKFLENKDLVVTFINPDGAGIPLTLGTHYAVNGAGNEKGGSIITTTALSGPGKLFVSRVMPVYQQTSLRNQGKFLAGTHEDVFDRLTMLIQQTDAIFSRAIRSTDYETLPQLPPAAVRAKKVMGFDSAGNPLTSNLTLEQLEQQPALALESAADAKASAIQASSSADRSGELADQSGEQADRAGDFAVAADSSAREAAESASFAVVASEAIQLSTGIFSTTAAGLTATSNSGYFSVPSAESNEYLVLYQKVAGVAVEIDRYPNSIAVQQPAWAGKKNGWPDPFFRVFDLKSQSLLGVSRWWCSAGAASDTQTPLQQGGWSRVKSGFFDGYALRRTANINTSPLNGPVIVLSEIDIAEGDRITAYQLFSGTGALVNAYVRFDDGASRGYVGPQVGMTTDSGDATLVSSSVPQRMKTSVEVPPGAKRLMTYAYTATADKTFDMLALWSFKGALADGPSWPAMDDRAVSDYKVASVTARMDATEPATTYVVDQYSKVEAASETVTLNGAGYAGFPRNLVFMGWGESYTPVGVTFNAIRVKAISRTVGAVAQWKTLNLVIRTGPTPETSLGVVVVVGKATVLEQNDTLNDVTFALKDPVTGALKTLNDASFTDGKYFVGVWALTQAGTPAACGEPRGTMPNSLLQAYYHQSSVNRPQTGTWNSATAGANNRQAFQHLNLTDPIELVEYTPTQKFAKALGETIVIPVPELVVPGYMYGVEGRESNLYFDNLFLCDAKDYLIDTTATSGFQQNERLTWIPAGALTNGAVTLMVADRRTGNNLVSATLQQRAAAISAGAGLTKKCLLIGDSLIQKGVITQTLLDVAATDAMKVELLGTLGAGANKHEGRGGWTVDAYTSSGIVSYRFTVAGVIDPPAINATEYGHNGAVYRVQEVSLVGGAGSITCSVESGGAPLASGSLTKTNAAAGDSVISFSASSTVSGNPFWFSGAVDFAQYLSVNSIAMPDWVLPGLGINNVFSATTDMAATNATDAALLKLDVLIASIKAAGPNIKVGLIIPTPPSSEQDSFGASYLSKEVRWRFKRNILIWARQMITKYAGQEADRIFLVPSNTALDTVNNMSRAASAPVNSRSTVMVSRQNNGVHPDTSGYQQIADAVWAFLKCNV